MDTETKRDRYLLEHKLLPEWILSDLSKDVLYAIVMNKGDFFVDLFQRMNSDIEDYQCPYSKDDFSVDGIFFEEDGFYLLKIQMPLAINEAECITIIIKHDHNFSNCRYITLEKGRNKDFLCEWTKDGNHLNYGAFSQETLLKVIKG